MATRPWPCHGERRGRETLVPSDAGARRFGLGRARGDAPQRADQHGGRGIVAIAVERTAGELSIVAVNVGSAHVTRDWRHAERDEDMDRGRRPVHAEAAQAYRDCRPRGGGVTMTRRCGIFAAHVGETIAVIARTVMTVAGPTLEASSRVGKGNADGGVRHASHARRLPIMGRVHDEGVPTRRFEEQLELRLLRLLGQRCPPTQQSDRIDVCW